MFGGLAGGSLRHDGTVLQGLGRSGSSRRWVRGQRSGRRDDPVVAAMSHNPGPPQTCHAVGEHGARRLRPL
ncbi:hypothetical protein FH063_000635 [Azospirillum argentinense]|uniref:Uncharacterized protein n=1 Tax=Azospirillum argentinense TaxID=2970906 RepID=A0A5B0L292_9PROT|nr:hypothetical protein FH063_000635 [Azospirillum argentinense]